MRAIAFALALLALVLGVNPLYASDPYTEEKINEAREYVLAVVPPAVNEAVSDPKCPPAIAAGVKALYEAIAQGKVLSQPTPGYDKVKDNLMGIIQTPYGPMLVIFSEAVKKLEKKNSRSDFGIQLALMMAHEALHLDDPADLTPQQREARVWPIVIADMVKPALSNGFHLPDLYKGPLAVFEQVRQNPQDPRWIKSFDSYFYK